VVSFHENFSFRLPFAFAFAQDLVAD